MNFIIDGNAGYLSVIGNAKDLAKNASSDVTRILFGAIKGDSAKSGALVKAGDIISASLVDASVSENGSFTGIIDINGSLLKSVITEDLYNEFVTGKTFNGEFGIPIKLLLSSINGKSPGKTNQYSGGAETQDILGNTVNSSPEFNIVFKVLNEASGENAVNIQKTLDLYGKAVAENIQGKFETLLNSLGSENSQISSGLSNEIQNILQNAAQNISVSVKGNFAFIHIDFGGSFGLSTVILTTGGSNYKVKNEDEKESGKKNPANSKKKYLFMIEINLKNLGKLKLFSYYYDKNLSIKFENYTGAFKKKLSENLELLKEMMSADGIKLNDISFKNIELNKPNEVYDDAESAAGQPNQASVNMNDSDPYVFLNGKIIDERI
jgi:hypothetical protein